MSDYFVAIDSMILVWGVRAQGTQEQRDGATWLFQELEEKEAQIIVPAISLSEYLVPVKDEDRNEQIAILSKRFIIAPFDVRCASLASQLFSRGKETREMGEENARKILKADCMIVATAAVHGARVFYSGDTKCRALAEQIHKWTVRDVPDTPPDLFSY